MELQKKDWVIVGLAAACLMLLIEVVQTQSDLKAQSKQIEGFLANKLKGIPLREYVRPDSLAVFPDSDGKAVACGVIDLKVSEKPKR